MKYVMIFFLLSLSVLDTRQVGAQYCYYFTGQTAACDNAANIQIFGPPNACGTEECDWNQFVGYFCEETAVEVSNHTWDGYTRHLESTAPSGGYRESTSYYLVCFRSAPCSCTEEETPVCAGPVDEGIVDGWEIVQIDINSECPDEY